MPRFPADLAIVFGEVTFLAFHHQAEASTGLRCSACARTANKRKGKVAPHNPGAVL